MRLKLNLTKNDNNAHSYIFRYGTLSEVDEFGERVWDGVQQDFRLYRFAYQTTGTLRLGSFERPLVFSQHNAGLPVEPGDKVRYPAVFCDWEGEYYF